MTPHKPTGGRPEDIPESVWDAAGREARMFIEWVTPQPTNIEADAEHVLTVSFARAIMAERRRWQPAVAYFNAYCLDEAEDARACVCGEAQHEAAKAFASAIRGGE